MSDLVDINDRLNAAADKAENGAQIIHDVANGDENLEVQTESGPIPTLASLLKRLDQDLGGAVDQAILDKSSIYAVPDKLVLGNDSGKIDPDWLPESALTKKLADYEALSNYSGPAKSIRITDVDTFGDFYLDEIDTESAEITGLVMLDALGRRWKRIYDGAPNIMWAGAKRGKEFDSASAIQEYLNHLPAVYVPDGDFGATVLYLKGKIFGGGWNSVLHKIGEGPLILSHGSLAGYTHLSVAPVVGSNSITLANDSLTFAPGEWAILESEDGVYPGDTGGKAGEIVLVQSQNGTSVLLHAPVVWTYTVGNGARLRKVDWLDTPQVENLRIRMNPNANADLYNDSADAIDFMFCLGPKVKGVGISEGKQAGVRLTGCVKGIVNDYEARDLASADDDVTGGYGYGVHERGANIGLSVTGSRFSRVRSGYTTGFGFNSVYPHGVSVAALIDGNIAIDTFSGSFTTHPSGIYTQITNNQIHGCRSSAINVRAKGTIVRGNTISKSIGAGILVVYDKGAVTDAVIEDNNLFDTNQGITPSGEDHRNYGAIQDTGPNSKIRNNNIHRCGGPAIRSSGTKNSIVKGNIAINPCQLTTTRKYAFGGDVAAVVGDHMEFSDNYCTSTDGKVINLYQKPTNMVVEGSGNGAKGITGALFAGESGNYYLTGSNGRADKNGRGRATTVRLVNDVLNLDQDSVMSSIIIVWAEGGSSSDTLSSISGGLEGCEIILRCVDGNTITIPHGTDSAKNIRTTSGASVILTGPYQLARFVKISGLWVQC